MGSYASADGPTRWKAITAVALVHVALGAIILNGLNVSIVRQAVERMQTFDIPLPKPPPPPPPPPPPKEQPRERQADEGAPEKKPALSPIVAPKPVLPVKSPVRAADVAGTGSASSAGAGGRGTGTGLGGTGTGTGTGSGDGRGFTPAQRISRIPNSEYRRLVSASGMRTGRVGIMVKVNTDGSPSNCRIMRSSGNPAADSMMCQMTLRHVRFRPALDPQGRPIAQDMGWSPDWSPLR
jgi:protein TonB